MLVVSIEYSNTFTYDPQVIRYQYHVSRVTHATFQTTEVIRQPQINSQRMLFDRRGIRLVFRQVGELGKFDFPTLLLTIVSGMALVSIANLSINYTIKWFPPVQALYRNEMFIDSAGEWGSGAFEIIEPEPETLPELELEDLPQPSHSHLPSHHPPNRRTHRAPAPIVRQPTTSLPAGPSLTSFPSPPQPPIIIVPDTTDLEAVLEPCAPSTTEIEPIIEATTTSVLEGTVEPTVETDLEPTLEIEHSSESESTALEVEHSSEIEIDLESSAVIEVEPPSVSTPMLDSTIVDREET